ncbi:TetR/AcrR family transcriptional regulator [Pedobacter sp. SYSU D00535]|uniref:TetR/AcrR family transcriptional regulator n=1 Tax=Pedobacter sp. SYSU D00535 TaxID=2810308 RepID=UPI001A969DA6|nr:TetR/AcrR family transcriptional regulator [Pedobacter sp. SYSU D00535]
MILEKAVLRFAHFGIQKTTMNEIAEDLAVSKPSLYYYFPDKTSLVVAVTEKILSEYFQQLEKEFESTSDVKTALFAMIELRNSFFKKYFMLHIGHHAIDINLGNEGVRALIQKAREQETGLIRNLFEKGIERGEIKTDDVVATATLFLDTMVGLNICIMAQQQKQLVPDSKGVDDVSEKQKSLTQIFLNGLKN